MCTTSSSMQRKPRAVSTPVGAQDSRREELYRALSARRALAGKIYFFSIILFTALLLQRRFVPSLVSSISLEIFIAFVVVTTCYYNLILLNSAKVTPSWAMGVYQQAGAMGMWLFTACWMVLYTTHIPPPLYHPGQWAITVFFLLLTSAMPLLSEVA